MIQGKVRIIFEDNQLLVVEKPRNMLSQEDNTGDADILSVLKEYVKNKYNKPGNVYLGLVHRLDRPVGGVMAFARTSKSASRLSEQIRTGVFKKSYLAVIHGSLEKTSGTLEHYLEKDEATNTVKVVPAGSGRGKCAVLDYNVLEHNGDLSLVGINLHTGRSHQIRVQLAAASCPLYGDQKYGQTVNKPGQQLALWSCGITLLHPVLKQEQEFRAIPPDEYPWNIFGCIKG